MNKITTSVRHLQPGDYLIGSQRTVIHVAPSTKRGKHNVVVRREDGPYTTHVWGSSTTMTIDRRGYHVEGEAL